MYKIALELTKNCNLNCSYCYQSHFTSAMDIETACRAIDLGIQKAKSLPAKKLLISFFGGEPLLQFSQIVSLVEYSKLSADGFDIAFEMTTNGTLLQAKHFEFFVEHQFFLKVSIDGLPDDHNLNRLTQSNVDSYQLVIRNLDLFKNYQRKLKKPVQVSMVISRNNYTHFLSNIRHLADLGFRMFDTALNFTDFWSDQELADLKIEYEKVVDFYFERIQNKKGFIWTFIDNGLMPQIKPRKNYFCGAGISSIFVTAEGELYPCYACFKDEVRIGSTAEGIDEARANRFKHYQRELTQDCIDCSIQAYCPACDCLMMNMEQTNDFHTVPKMFCEHAKMRYELTNKLHRNSEWNRMLETMSVSKGG